MMTHGRTRILGDKHESAFQVSIVSMISTICHLEDQTLEGLWNDGHARFISPVDRPILYPPLVRVPSCEHG